MMTADEIIEAANRAYHENRLDDWRAWHSLLSLMGLMPDGCGKLVAVTEVEQQARERLVASRLEHCDHKRRDDTQFDYEREAEAQGVLIQELVE